MEVEARVGRLVGKSGEYQSSEMEGKKAKV
jgi:hypothetical protein